MRKNYFQAIAVMVGYVIGVGMFGLPFLISRAGLLSFFVILIILAFVQHFIHLIYANVILETPSSHRMAGYAGIYLGKFWKQVTFLAKLIGNYGALLAYIIITGIFLNQLLGPYLGGNEFIYASILFFIEAIIVFFGIGMIARAELFMTILLLLVVAMISVKGLGVISTDNYLLVDWKYFFLPYGAMLFAIDGNGALPMVVRLVKRDKNLVKKVVKIGTFLPVLVIFVFTLMVVGISGGSTTPDALTGMGVVLKDGVIFFALIFGVLTMITSFFGVAESIKETLWWDYKFNKRIAWALAVFVPYFLYVFGFKDLIEIISFAGAIAGGISAIVLILIFSRIEKVKKRLILFKRKPNLIIIGLLISMFIAGIIYELWAFNVL